MKRFFLGIVIGILAHALYMEHIRRERETIISELREKELSGKCPYFIDKGDEFNAVYHSP